MPKNHSQFYKQKVLFKDSRRTDEFLSLSKSLIYHYHQSTTDKDFDTVAILDLQCILSCFQNMLWLIRNRVSQLESVTNGYHKAGNLPRLGQLQESTILFKDIFAPEAQHLCVCVCVFFTAILLHSKQYAIKCISQYFR